jgi:uncharacterized repeat protein (TIGR01451 family)
VGLLVGSVGLMTFLVSGVLSVPVADAATAKVFTSSVHDPVGVAATPTALYVSTYGGANLDCNTIYSVSTTGVATAYADLAQGGFAPCKSDEIYLAVAPENFGTFTTGTLFATDGPNIYDITPGGCGTSSSCVHLFATATTLVEGAPGGSHTGITFATAGPFAGDLLVVGETASGGGDVYVFGPGGGTSSSPLASIPASEANEGFEAPSVLPPQWGPYAGQLITVTDQSSAAFMVSNTGVVTEIPGVNGAEATAVVPASPCNYGGSSYFASMINTSNVLGYAPSDLAGLNGDVLVNTEGTNDGPPFAGVLELTPSGTSALPTVSTFDDGSLAATSQEGGSIANCPVNNTTLTTSLSGGGKSGATITVPSGTAVTDQATLHGATSGAGGTVTYGVFTDNMCQDPLSGATPGTSPVVGGVVQNSSNPVTLTASGPGNTLYYWQASYSGDTSTGDQPSVSTCTAEVATVTPVLTGSVSISKKSSVSSVSAPGPVTYTFTVTNGTNETLTNADVTDTIDQETTPPTPLTTSAITCTVNGSAVTNGSFTLAPSGVAICTATLTVTQAMIDNGQNIVDTGNVTGTLGTGSSATSVNQPSNTVTVTITQSPKITTTKMVTSGPGPYNAVGDVITYQFVVTNAGNVTLTGVGVNDDVLGTTTPVKLTTGPTCQSVTGGSACSGNSVTLSPGGSATFTATYTVTQADLDNGSVNDQATACNANSTTPPPANQTCGTSPPVTVPTPETGSVTISKKASVSSVSAPGSVTYTFTVANGTNETLSSADVTDAIAQGTTTLSTSTIACTVNGSPVTNGSFSLAPNASATCTATLTVTQAMIDNGQNIVDTGNVTGTLGTGSGATSVNQPSNTVTVTITQSPALTTVKSVTSTGPYNKVGQVVDYQFVVKNTGNVTLTGVGVTDDVLGTTTPVKLTTGPTCQSVTGGSACSGNSVTLSPGGSATFTATYTLTQADLTNGSVGDVATACGDTINTTTQTCSPGSPVTIPITEIVMSGRAYALGLSASLLTGVAIVGPDTVQDTGATNTALSSTTPNPCGVDLNVLDVALTGDVCSGVTTNAVTETSSSSSSVANAVIQLGHGLPVIALQAVASTSRTSCAGSSGSSTIVALSIGGVAVKIPSPLPPNSTINLGVVTLVLNQQIPFSVGGDQGLTVNAIHISVNVPLVATANVVVASSTSDIACAAPFKSPLFTAEANVANLTASALGKSVLGDITVNSSGPVLTQTPSVSPAPCVASLAIPDIAFTGEACAGFVTTSTTSTAIALVANAAITVPNIVPTIQIQALESQSSTTCTGSSGSVTIAYLRIGSTVLINKPTTVNPNTVFVVGPVTLTLNQQTAFNIGGDRGLKVTGLAVNVNLGATAQANLTIANSTSDIIGC